MIELITHAASTSDPELWLSVGLPIGIAVVGLAGTLGVTAIQLSARRNELQDDRIERAAIASDTERLQAMEARADAVEQIVTEIAKYADTLGAEIKRITTLRLPADTHVAYPSNFNVKRAISRLTTKARERRLTDASLTFLRDSGTLSLVDQPLVYGVLQERLEFWFTGERSLDETIQILNSDGAGFREGRLPPQIG